MPKKGLGRDLTRLETVLLSVLAGQPRYGLAIRKAAEGLGQQVSLASLYTSLMRLEEAGLIKGEWGDATEERRGARRRYYRITGVGEAALREAKTVLKKAFGFAPGTALIPAEGV